MEYENNDSQGTNYHQEQIYIEDQLVGVTKYDHYQEYYKNENHPFV